MIYVMMLSDPTSRERELYAVTMWSAAVEMPTRAAVFSGLAMAASSINQPPKLEPTIIYKKAKIVN